MKPRQQMLPTCEPWKPTPQRLTSGHGVEFQLNGEARADDQFPKPRKEIEQRTSPFQLAGNRNAAHPINAMLNYAYAVLQSQIQINAVADGYDPTVGIM